MTADPRLTNSLPDILDVKLFLKFMQTGLQKDTQKK